MLNGLTRDPDRAEYKQNEDAVVVHFAKMAATPEFNAYQRISYANEQLELKLKHVEEEKDALKIQLDNALLINFPALYEQRFDGLIKLAIEKTDKKFGIWEKKNSQFVEVVQELKIAHIALGKDAVALEKDKTALENEKKVLENEKKVLENEKKVLESEKKVLEEKVILMTPDFETGNMRRQQKAESEQAAREVAENQAFLAPHLATVQAAKKRQMDADTMYNFLHQRAYSTPVQPMMLTYDQECSSKNQGSSKNQKLSQSQRQKLKREKEKQQTETPLERNDAIVFFDSCGEKNLMSNRP